MRQLWLDCVPAVMPVRTLSRAPASSTDTPQPRHRWEPTGAPAQDREARRRNFPRPPGSAGRSRTTRRRHRSTPETDTRTPPPWLPGATEGNHGESTGIGDGRSSANARRTRAGRPPDRQRRQRAWKDSLCVFLLGGGVWRPVAPRGLLMVAWNASPEASRYGCCAGTSPSGKPPSPPASKNCRYAPKMRWGTSLGTGRGRLNRAACRPSCLADRSRKPKPRVLCLAPLRSPLLWWRPRRFACSARKRRDICSSCSRSPEIPRPRR